MPARNRNLSPTANPSDIAIELRRARLVADLSQADMGKIVGVREQSIGVWERGAAYPQGRHRQTLKNALGWIATLHPELEHVEQPVTSDTPKRRSSEAPLPQSADPNSLGLLLHGFKRLESRGVPPREVASLFFKITSIGMLAQSESHTERDAARTNGRQRIVELIADDPLASDADILPKALSLMAEAYGRMEAVDPTLAKEREVIEKLSGTFLEFSETIPRSDPLLGERLAADILEGAGF